MTSKINLGLERISRLLRRLDNPHKRYDVIHVAGTNGKGSVSAMIANTLTRAGVKTGLYTSPHLKYRWDTIRINNQEISYADYSRVDASIKAETKGLENEMRAKGQPDSDVSTFEQMTATAFQTFREQEVEVAVVEVGLGGAHDATNVVQPIISVITSIGLDHTAFLGSSIQEIARAKGGIIKQGTPVVVSSDQEYGQVYGVLGHIQREVNPNSKIIWTPPNSTLDFRISNKNTARTALEHLKEQAAAGKCSSRYDLSSEVIEEGFSTTKWSGRCSSEDLSALGGSIDTLIDGAHNDQSIEALDNVIAESRNKPRTFIVALTKGKSLNCLDRLLRPGDQLFTVEFEDVDEMEWIRPVDSHELCSALVENSKFALPGQAYGKDVAGAIKDSDTITNERDLVICGSLYLVGQVYRMLDFARHETAAFPDNASGSLGAYEPAAVESKVQQYWSALPPTNPAAGQHKSGIIKFLLPPPNVTGSLHIGHALTVAIQDTYCRYFHAMGHQVQWVPGVDHAGIATQSVVAKSLAKLGVQAHDLSREDFVSRIWNWRHQYGNIINQQIRRLGTSLDWSSEYFTMDQPRAAAVNEAFRKLWDAGLITRENRMVNWSVPLQSVISDIEVDTKVIETPTMLHGAEFGKMWRIRFELSEPTSTHQFIEVDTTRPETIFADRAVAVHPRDERYAAIVGHNLKHPLLADVMLKVVADSQVASDFGTGCVKLTPAHDRNDHEISQRHSDIPCISVFGRDGKMLDFPGYTELAGQDRLQARAKVVKILEQKGALSTSRPHKTTLHLCSRSGAVIEPLLIPQWYIKMQGLADQVQQQNNIKMSSKTAKEWNKWLSNVEDWCVSRQLVWGHRVPLWRITEPNNGAEQWVFGVSEVEASKNANGREVVQDGDVLDTWFSSGLLPLSAFGWPSKTFENHQSLEFIESGPDILFFWLARMAMLCTFLTGTPPFKEIILHPLIRDSQGRKMSKSLGNVIDPMSLIEGQRLEELHANLERGNMNASELKNAVKETTQQYPEGMPAYGADALRFALIQSTVQTEALKFDVRSVTAARYLCNKLWNAVNFYAYNMNKHNLLYTDLPNSSEAYHSLADDWILLLQNYTIENYHTGFKERDLAASSEALRTFFLDQFCDIYLEFVKIDIRQAGGNRVVIAQKLSLVREILADSLHRFSPFMPHVTEYLWHTLGNKCSLHGEVFRASTTRSLPLIEDSVIARMKTLLTTLQALRTLSAQQIDTVEIVITKDNDSLDDITTHVPHLQAMASLPKLSINTNSSTLQNVLPITSNLSIFYNTLVAIDTQIPSSADRRNLAKLEKLRALVATDDYSSRVPEAIKHKHRAEIMSLETRLERFL